MSSSSCLWFPSCCFLSYFFFLFLNLVGQASLSSVIFYFYPPVPLELFSALCLGFTSGRIPKCYSSTSWFLAAHLPHTPWIALAVAFYYCLSTSLPRYLGWSWSDFRAIQAVYLLSFAYCYPAFCYPAYWRNYFCYHRFLNKGLGLKTFCFTCYLLQSRFWQYILIKYGSSRGGHCLSSLTSRPRTTHNLPQDLDSFIDLATRVKRRLRLCQQRLAPCLSWRLEETQPSKSHSPPHSPPTDPEPIQLGQLLLSTQEKHKG